MSKKQLKELLNICSLHDLNPKKLKEFNQAIKIYKDERIENAIRKKK